ncbi:transcriptional regulator [Bacillus sp. AFS001701]|uniref:helix-turn-helix domain-containing protein n=1 Tax=Bacillus sp. AFS001701 TaxID=2033480 RepID=UPI000BF273AB|nr:helix-turn-helix transcriptional regulator [Bacillus sp. AFS001701]PET70076.1 transcriptional regulator [Bacillus sp. AFS001701]
MAKITIRLKEALDQRNITQKQLSEMTGLRPAAISQLCNNFVQRISIEHIEKISEALEITDTNELLEITK